MGLFVRAVCLREPLWDGGEMEDDFMTLRGQAEAESQAEVDVVWEEGQP